MTHKHKKKLLNLNFFEVLNVLFCGLKDSPGHKYSKFQFFLSKKINKFSAVFFSSFGHQIPGSVSDPDSLEMLDPDPD
jgi:hypothetical protein